jgi:hypothetical protein
LEAKEEGKKECRRRENTEPKWCKGMMIIIIVIMISHHNAAAGMRQVI